MWRGVHGTLASAPQLKTNPPVQRGLWALALLSTTTRLLPFPPCILGWTYFIQLDLVDPGRAKPMAWWENMSVMRIVNFTSALATSVEPWMSAYVPTWPETLMTSHNWEKSRNTIPQPRGSKHRLYEFTQVEVLDSSPVCVHRVLNIYSSLDTLPLENTVQRDI